jgi:hypothetical protein
MSIKSSSSQGHSQVDRQPQGLSSASLLSSNDDDAPMFFLTPDNTHRSMRVMESEPVSALPLPFFDRVKSMQVQQALPEHASPTSRHQFIATSISDKPFLPNSGMLPSTLQAPISVTQPSHGLTQEPGVRPPPLSVFVNSNNFHVTPGVLVDDLCRQVEIVLRSLGVDVTKDARRPFSFNCMR